MERKLSLLALLTSVTVLSACSTEQTSQDSTTVSESSMVETESSMASHDMVHDDSGELPAGLEEAAAPTYEVGDKVTLLNDHMPGMEGATATIVGSFDTIAYEVTYEPTDGSEKVENHRWVVQEEITEAKDSDEALEAGSEVQLEAHHMEGMEGATATIDAVEETTVYMLDYEPTDGSETVKNHKWFIESELEPQN
ncbi:YdhK family protein [Jeotgalibaca sp. A122]|uniref:YdhK family protein n=1 Tax=Jeotgalibaca sp. A122 TaxID=3457322 RepID=UPI003FD57533